MSTHLEPGAKAPAFSAPAADGTTVKMSDWKGKKNVVLFFYVKDNTPGCTREARAFRDAVERFDEKDTVVLGVGVGSAASHARFAANNELEFPLVVDVDGKIAEKYGVLKSSGKSAERATFLIDPDGKIRHVWPKVSITGHTTEILEKIDELGLA